MTLKKKASDYAGIAAIITALGGVISVWVDNTNTKANQTKLQESILAVLQHRISVVERYCLPPPPSPAPRPEYGFGEGAEEAADEAFAEAEEAATVVEMEAEVAARPRAMVRKAAAVKRAVRARVNVSLDDIQAYVEETQEALTIEGEE